MVARSFAALVLSLLAASAAAQQRPIFDADDFVDPRQIEKPLFVTRLILGAARNLVDDYRPLRRDGGFLQIANSYYLQRWQFDYKHSEVRGENDPPPPVRCQCNGLYFPTPPLADQVPLAPKPGSRDALQVGFYRPVRGGPAGPPIMLRTRLTATRQQIGSVVKSPTAAGIAVERRSGREQSFGLDADTHFVFRGHDLWGSVNYAYTSRSGTIDDRTQQELTYTARPPGWSVGRVLMRSTLTAGGVSNRGGTALNVVNPAVEAFFHSRATGADFHAVWSPVALRDSTGWQRRHQIAVFVEYVKLWH